MTDEWEPLPQRKRIRRALGAAATATATAASLPNTSGTNGTAPTTPAIDTAAPPARATEGGGGGASRHANPDAANLEKVASAVMERAASQRAAREGGEDGMGNDGVGGEFYEYLDHTADVQLHAWGKDLTAALEHLVPCMSNYMTDLSTVEIDPTQTQELEVEGHDLPSLLFTYLDEFLFRFSTEAFVAKQATILEFQRPLPKAEADDEAGKAEEEGEGRAAGAAGTAAGMAGGGGGGGGYRIRVRAEGEGFDLAKHPQGTEIKAITYSNMQIHEKGQEGRADVYVIVDI